MPARKSIQQLQHENAVMREALDWYAIKTHWRRKAISPKGAPIRKWEKSLAAYDRGGRARVVIELIDSPRSGPLTRLFARLIRKPPPRAITTPAARPIIASEDTE